MRTIDDWDDVCIPVEDRMFQHLTVSQWRLYRQMEKDGKIIMSTKYGGGVRKEIVDEILKH